MIVEGTVVHGGTGGGNKWYSDTPRVEIEVEEL